MWQIIGWIIWVILAFLAVSCAFGCRTDAKSGRNFQLATGVQTFFFWVIATLFLVFGWNKLHILWVTPVAYFTAQFLVFGEIPILSPIVLFATRIFLFVVLIGVEKPTLESDAHDNISDAFLPSSLAADWKYFYADADRNNFFYDPQSISRGQNTIKVQTKFVWGDKFKADLGMLPYPGIEKTSYNIDKWEINSQNNEIRITASLFCDSKGAVIFSENNSDSQFRAFFPDTVEEALVEILCSEQHRAEEQLSLKSNVHDNSSVTSLASSIAADWKYFYTDEDGEDFFYDAQSFSLTRGTTRVRVKRMLSDKNKALFKKVYRNHNGIENLSYILYEKQINRAKNKSRTTFMGFCGSEGDVIISLDYSDKPEQFREIIPEDYLAKLVEIICAGGK